MMILSLFLFITWSGYSQTAVSDRWAVWDASDGNDSEIYYAHQVGGQWTTPTLLNHDNSFEDVSPSIAMNSQGKPFVVWVRERGEQHDLYCSKWNGTEWSPEEQIGSNVGIRLGQPAAVVDEEGQIWVVAAGVKNGVDDIYWTHRLSSGSWSGWACLNEENAVPDLDPSILIFNQNVWVVWSHFDGQGYRLFTRVWDGSKWSAQSPLFPNEKTSGEFPSLSVQQGKASLVFYQNQKSFLSQLEGKNWSAPIPNIIPIEPTLMDVWKTQGVTCSNFSWFGSQEDRGSQIILLFQGKEFAVTPKTLASRLKKFFTISGNEAWAAGNANVYSAFGDSITEGYPQGSYVPSLQAKLIAEFGSANVVNRGVGGENSSSGLARFPSVLSADNPEFILIMEGTNDITGKRSPESIVFNLGAMVDLAISQGVRPILGTITPRRDRVRTGLTTNELIRGLAGQKGVSLSDNYAAIAAVPDFDTTILIDHVHINSTGNEILAQTWFSTIKAAKGRGNSKSSGGCGSVTSVLPKGGHPINLEPLFLLFLFLFLARNFKRISQSR